MTCFYFHVGAQVEKWMYGHVGTSHISHVRAIYRTQQKEEDLFIENKIVV